MLVGASVAQLAPELEVERWFGPARPLSTLRGKVVVVHAFQMLCPGCVLHGVPQAARIHAHFAGSDVVVLGLHTVFEHHAAMTPTSLEAFLSEFRVPFPVAVDAPSERSIPRSMQRYGLRGTPSLLLIDRDGRLRANVFGRPEDLAVGAAIAQLLGEVSTGCDADGCAIGPV